MDVCRRQADSLPGLFSGNEERVIVCVNAIGPMVTLEVVPQVLDRVEFGGISWQREQGHVVRHFQRVGAMVSCPVPDQHGLHVGSQGLRELLEKLIDDHCVQVGCDDRFGLTGFWTSGTNHIDIGILRLAHGSGA